MVVGDACTEDTEDVVIAFQDDRIRFVKLGRNFGEQAAPNNIGMSLTDASLVACLNHDDIWLPDHLSICHEVLLGEQADLVFAGCVYIAAESPRPLALPGLVVGLGGAGTIRRRTSCSACGAPGRGCAPTKEVSGS